MIDFLSLLVTLGLCAQAAVGLSYLISSIREREKRASVFAGVQLIGMTGLTILFIYWWQTGFFFTTPGIVIPICFLLVGVAAGVLLMRKTQGNAKALKGTKGLIVGEVKRPDERDIVFARNRSLRPGSEQYNAYYALRPEVEQAERGRCHGVIGHTVAPVSTGAIQPFGSS
jgi:hypothetical protein